MSGKIPSTEALRDAHECIERPGAPPFNPEMLRLARMSRGWKQETICAKTSLSQGFVSKLENGQSSPNARTVAQLADALCYPPAFFFQTGYIHPLPHWFYAHS